MRSSRQIQAWKRANILFQLNGMIAKLDRMQREDVRSGALWGKIQSAKIGITSLRDFVKNMPNMDVEELCCWFNSDDWHTAFNDE